MAGEILVSCGVGRGGTDTALRASKLQAIGAMTIGIAHDFNNLLTPIMWIMTELHEEQIGSGRQRRRIKGALDCADRASRLVQRMLNVARMLPPLIEPVDIADLLAGMNEIFVCALGPRITITVHIPPDLPFVSVDRNQVEMALLNLAINARDAMPNGGILAISALAEPTLVRLSFEDTGSGMDDLTLGQATDAFFSTKARGRGTGLGLSNIQQLITDLGGRFSIASTPGIGTRIDLRLPVARSRACVDVGAVDSRPSRGQPSPG